MGQVAEEPELACHRLEDARCAFLAPIISDAAPGGHQPHQPCGSNCSIAALFAESEPD